MPATCHRRLFRRRRVAVGQPVQQPKPLQRLRRGRCRQPDRAAGLRRGHRAGRHLPVRHRDDRLQRRHRRSGVDQPGSARQECRGAGGRPGRHNGFPGRRRAHRFPHRRLPELRPRYLVAAGSPRPGHHCPDQSARPPQGPARACRSAGTAEGQAVLVGIERAVHFTDHHGIEAAAGFGQQVE